MTNEDQWISALYEIAKVGAIALAGFVVVTVVALAIGEWLSRKAPIAPDWMDDEPR